jgi:deazaflavin-dependent oxidoreductase (nitroreductase family)
VRAALLRLAQWIGRQPWLTTIGPRIVNTDIRLQRWTRGQISFGRLAGLSSLLLTTTGRRSGEPRYAPLISIPDGDSLLLVASNFGRPKHPNWSANLIANPDARAQIKGHDFAITATLLTGEDRASAWKTVTTAWPAYNDYQARVSREIRVFRLTRRP